MHFYNPLSPLKPATPEGHAGRYAHIYLPFYGYWFASGQQYTFLTGEIVQRPSRPVLGLSRPDTFRKDCCDCPSTTAVVI
jgi:hypothetical protein